MTSEIKVNKVSDSCGSALVTKCGSTITLGASGKTVAIASGASTSGMGRTGTVDWCSTAKTSPFTAVSGDGFFVNTSGGAITVTLPASPSAGDIVSLADYQNTWASNNLTICRNSSKINGNCANVSLNTDGQSVTLIYVDGTRGWKNIQDSTSNVTGTPSYIVATGGTILTSGDYKTHVFTSDANFVVDTAPTPGNNTVDYYVVAGGGGAASNSQQAGAGAGGFRVSNDLCVSAPTMSPLANSSGLPVSASTTYPITVGGGGAAGSSPSDGTKGSDSIFSSITSAGGGAGTADNIAAPSFTAGSGGSGAGQRGENPNGASVFSGNTPPVSPPQGNNGGAGGTGSPARAGGGGGGAGAVGTNNDGQGGGPGGVGSYIADSVFGPTAPSYGTPGPVSSTRYFAGGGGGGTEGNPSIGAGTNGTGGAGGGGQAGPGPAAPGAGQAGTTNTGGGGGGASRQGSGSGIPGTPGGAGGSGFVAIWYKFQ